MSSTTDDIKFTVNEALSKKPKVLSYINAAAAVYRSQNAPEDAPFQPTEEQQALFLEAQKFVAGKHNITPNKDGTYSQKHLEKELKPEAIIKVLAFDHYRETQNNEKAFNDINQEFQSVYEDERNGPKQIVPECFNSLNNDLKSISFMTDNDFLNSDKKTKENYLKGIKGFPAEISRLKALSSNKTKAEAVDLRNKDISSIDTATPTADKDFKSSSKDFIDYLMEQIMEATDWVNNRIIDAEICVLFGTAYGLKNGFKYLKEKYEDSKGSSIISDINDTNDTTETLDDSSLDKILSNYETEKTNITNNLNADEKFSPFAFDFMKKLIDREILIEEQGYREKSNNELHDYSELSDKENIHDKLLEIRTTLDAWVASKLNSKLNKNQDSKLKTAITERVIKTNKNLEKPSTETIDFPQELIDSGINEDNMKTEFDEAKKDAVVSLKINSIKKRMENSSTLFAINYSTYKLTEMARKGNESDLAKIQNPEELKKLKIEFEAEGKLLMYENYKALRNNDGNAISEEEMLQLSEKMAETSKKLYEENDNETDSPDLIKERFSVPKNESISHQTMSEYQATFGDVINIELNNIDILNKEKECFEQEQREIDEKRQIINDLKAERSKINTEKRHIDAKELKKFIEDCHFESRT